MRRALCAALVLASSLAHANVWDRAIESDKPERAADDQYDSEMREGDEHAIAATAMNASYKEVKRQIDLAATSYRAAAAAKPAASEPHFRVGKLLYSAYFDCTDFISRMRPMPTCNVAGRLFDRDKARQIIAAWDAFEARAPLDPRLSVSVSGESEILFDRAILHTKLATKADLEAAALDYEKLLARHDTDGGASSRVLGNLAETYMMLGRMDESVETYREALRGASDTSTWYGYAVALDRDESTQQALEIIRSLGSGELESFQKSVTEGITFFVPQGESFYYFALAEEAFGNIDDSIKSWDAYIDSKAHPEFQPRARAHLDALLKQQKRKAIRIDPPWADMLP